MRTLLGQQRVLRNTGGQIVTNGATSVCLFSKNVMTRLFTAANMGRLGRGGLHYVANLVELIAMPEEHPMVTSAAADSIRLIVAAGPDGVNRPCLSELQRTEQNLRAILREQFQHEAQVWDSTDRFPCGSTPQPFWDQFLRSGGRIAGGQLLAEIILAHRMVCNVLHPLQADADEW